MKKFNKILIYTSLILLSLNVYAQEKKELKVGLTLSGGGAKGLAHVGVIKVLEKAGVKIDYITGTSMGAIVGGLYAIGYSADTIVKIANTLNWNSYINDEIERKNLSFEEKLNYQKYVLTLPFSWKKIRLPSALHQGQGISLLLSDMTKHVHSINDFSKLPIPFACIAADIGNGKADVLKSGYLAQAMQASMAIPTVFAPVEINNKLYVDGGLLNNFPVKENKEMGADIIIGVDVQSPFYTKEEITSPLEILGQSGKILIKEANQEARELCNVLIRPKVTHYSVLDFDNPEEIIALGENAAREALPKIIHLFDSLGIKHNKRIIRKIKSVESVYIDTIVFNGISERLRNRILKSIKFKTRGIFKYTEIDQLVDQLYGTMNFHKVIYKIDKLNGKKALIINLKEKNIRDLKLGVHYDTDLKNGLLFNYTSNKVFINELKLQANLLISENPRTNVKLLFNSNGVINPIWEINADNLYLRLYNNYKPTFWYRNKSISSKFSIFTNLHPNFRIGGSVEWLRSFIKFTSSLAQLDNPSQNFVNLSAQMDLDSRNKTYYPTKGSYFKLLARIIDETQDNNLTYTSLETSLRFEPIISIRKRLALQPKLFAGAIINNHDNEPNWYLYKLGGAFNWKDYQYIPFIGYKFGQAINKTYLIARTDVQFELFPNHYLIAKMNVMQQHRSVEDFISKQNKTSDLEWGYGISYAYNSIIGPLELNISRSHLGETNVYFSFGFWF